VRAKKGLTMGGGINHQRRPLLCLGGKGNHPGPSLCGKRGLPQPLMQLRFAQQRHEIALVNRQRCFEAAQLPGIILLKPLGLGDIHPQRRLCRISRRGPAEQPLRLGQPLCIHCDHPQRIERVGVFRINTQHRLKPAHRPRPVAPLPGGGGGLEKVLDLRLRHGRAVAHSPGLRKRAVAGKTAR
jgi:hypothetical protein